MFQYAAPSSLCADLYKRTFGNKLETVPRIKNFTVSIQHPDGRTWKRDGSVIRLNKGTDMHVATYHKEADTYRPNFGYVALLDQGSQSNAIHVDTRNTNLTLGRLEDRAQFAWFFLYNEAKGFAPGYFVMSALDNRYLGYDAASDQVICVPKSDSRVVRWTLLQTSNAKSQLKAVAFMHFGRGKYMGESGSVNVNACVLPKETLKTMRIQSDTCVFLDKSVGSTLYPTVGGVLDSDRKIAASQIKQGQGVIPIKGCATSTLNPKRFSQVVKDAANIIDRGNITMMNNVRKRVSEKFQEVQDLQDHIQKRRDALDSAKKDYADYLAQCKTAKAGIPKQTSDIAELEAECKQRMLINNASRANYCLDIVNSSRDDNAHAVGNSCDNRPSQHWRMDQMGRIKSKLSGKCLGALNGGAANLTPVVQTPCSDAAHQQWFRDPAWGTLQPRHAPNMCLHVAGNGGENETVYIAQCDANPSKRWTDNPSLTLVPNPAPPPPAPVPQRVAIAQQPVVVPPPRGKVQLFSDCGYGGQMVERRAGNYINSLAMGMPNDSLSSMKIPPGYKVILYKDANYSSVSREFTSDVACLADFQMDSKKKWNDNASSMKIIDLL